MKEIKLNLSEKSILKLKEISNATGRDISEVVDDLINTFCCAPTIVIADLEEMSVKAMEKCNIEDAHHEATLTKQRLKGFDRIKFFTNMIITAQEYLINKYEENFNENDGE